MITKFSFHQYFLYTWNHHSWILENLRKNHQEEILEDHQQNSWKQKFWRDKRAMNKLAPREFHLVLIILARKIKTMVVLCLPSHVQEEERKRGCRFLHVVIITMSYFGDLELSGRHNVVNFGQVCIVRYAYHNLVPPRKGWCQVSVLVQNF